MDQLALLKKMLEAELRKYDAVLLAFDPTSKTIEIDVDPDTPENRMGAAKLIKVFIHEFENLTDLTAKSVNDTFEGVLDIVRKL